MKKLITMLAVAGAGASMLALALIGSASAHAPYDSSTPAKGANLTTPPASVVINFQASIQRTAGSFGATVTKPGSTEELGLRATNYQVLP
jgi:methionine-rich copper-binding protein CopC